MALAKVRGEEACLWMYWGIFACFPVENCYFSVLWQDFKDGVSQHGGDRW